MAVIINKAAFYHLWPKSKTKKEKEEWERKRKRRKKRTRPCCFLARVEQRWTRYNERNVGSFYFSIVHCRVFHFIQYFLTNAQTAALVLLTISCFQREENTDKYFQAANVAVWSPISNLCRLDRQMWSMSVKHVLSFMEEANMYF